MTQLTGAVDTAAKIKDLEDELAYTSENALYLMKNSSNFDAFVSEQVSDLGNFSTSSSTK